MDFIQLNVVFVPNIMWQFILLLLFADLVSVHCHIYDEAGSVSLIDKIDRYHRSTDNEFNDDVNLFDDHGHTGHDDENLIGTSRYTNEWVVKITGGAGSAAKLAEEMGFEINGQVIFIVFFPKKKKIKINASFLYKYYVGPEFP